MIRLLFYNQTNSVACLGGLKKGTNSLLSVCGNKWSKPIQTSCTVFPYLYAIRTSRNSHFSSCCVIDAYCSHMHVGLRLLWEHTAWEVSRTLQNASVGFTRHGWKFQDRLNSERTLCLCFVNAQMCLREKNILKCDCRSEPAFDACMIVLWCCSSVCLHCSNLQA